VIIKEIDKIYNKLMLKFPIMILQKNDKNDKNDKLNNNK
jgi:hypothetical protein